jgi:hypothetical protein
MLRLLKSFVVVGIIFGFIATGTVYADLSGWDGKWFEVKIKEVSVCYDTGSSKFVEDNSTGTCFLIFWWDESIPKLQVDIYCLDDEDWDCTALTLGRIGGNDLEFLFNIGLPVQTMNDFHSSTQIMHSQLVNGQLKSAFFLPLGTNFGNRDTYGESDEFHYDCAGQRSLSGKLINYVPVPPDDIMENGCK